MKQFSSVLVVSVAALAAPLTMTPLPAAANELPEAIAVSGETLVATVQAVGSQIYECKADASGRLLWQFREPVATLFMDGRTVGRHYAGPQWEMEDGSTASAKPTGRSPGASEDDIPLLRLEVTSRRGIGQLADVTTVLRLNTNGGVTEGACETAGMIQNVPYSADYAFYRPSGPNLGAAAPAAQPAVRTRSVRTGDAPAIVAAPAPVRAVNVIVLPRDLPYWPRKKRGDRPNKPGEPTSPPTPPTAEPDGPAKPPATPTPTPTAEPKAPRTPRPASGGVVVRDHRGVDPDSRPGASPKRQPVVRDHRGVDRAPPKPRGAEGDPKVRDHRGIDPESRAGPSPQRAPIVRDHRAASRTSPYTRTPIAGPNVRDNRGVTRTPPAPRTSNAGPIVRDHRGVDREPPKPRGAASPTRGAAGGGSLPCGASGLPPCRAQ